MEWQAEIEKGKGTHARRNQSEFREQFLREATVFNKDVAAMRPAVLQIAKAMSDDSELNRLVARFLSHEAAPTTLYVEHLRHRIRPGAEVIADRLGEIFVRTEAGNYVVRPSRRADAERFLKVGKQFNDFQDPLARELAIFSEDLSDEHKLDRQLKAAMQQPLFVVMIAAELIDEEREFVQSQAMDHLFDQLESVTVDTSGGLSVQAEAHDEVAELLERHKRIDGAAQRYSRQSASSQNYSSTAANWSENGAAC